MSPLALPAYIQGDSFELFGLIPDATILHQFVIDVLNQQLNSEIAYRNAQEPTLEPMRTTTEVIPAPSGIINDKYINNVLVGMALERESFGHRKIENRGTITIWKLDERITDLARVTPTWRDGDMIAAIFEPYSGGLPQSQYNITGWNELFPVSVTRLPDEASEFSGIAVTFSFKQPAECMVPQG